VQSNRRAVPRWQHSALATVNPFHKRPTLTFDLLTSLKYGYIATAMDYICTNFGVGSSSRLPFTARTHRRQKPDQVLAHCSTTAGVAKIEISN